MSHKGKASVNVEMSQIINADEDEAAAAIVEERRIVRGEQRELENMIAKAQIIPDGSNDIDIDVVEGYRTQMNALFQQVHHTREQLQDAEVLKALSKKVSASSNKMSQNQNKYEFDAFTQGLIDKFSEVTGRSGQTREFQWAALGKNVMPLFLAVPTYQGFASNLEKDATKSEVKRTARVHEDLGPEAKPINVRQTLDSETSELNEASNERIQKLHECVEDAENMDLLSLLVDSKDAVQSVENFFDYAFLIKDKKVTIESTQHNSVAPMTSCVPECEEGEEEEENGEGIGGGFDADSVKQQHVLTLGIKDLRRVGKLLELLDESKRQELESQHSCSSSSSSSSSSLRLGNSQTESQSESQYMSQLNPVHRMDRLYTLKTAQDQAQALLTAQQKKQGLKVIPTKTNSKTKSAAKTSSSSSSSSSASTGKRKRD